MIKWETFKVEMKNALSDHIVHLFNNISYEKQNLIEFFCVLIQQYHMLVWLYRLKFWV